MADTKTNVHVSQLENKNWAVRYEGNDNETNSFDTQDKAIEEGRKLTKQNNVDLIIHDTEGNIRDKESFSNK